MGLHPVIFIPLIVYRRRVLSSSALYHPFAVRASMLMVSSDCTQILKLGQFLVMVEIRNIESDGEATEGNLFLFSVQLYLASVQLCVTFRHDLTEMGKRLHPISSTNRTRFYIMPSCRTLFAPIENVLQVTIVPFIRWKQCLQILLRLLDVFAIG